MTNQRPAEKYPRVQSDAIAEHSSDLAWRQAAGEDMAGAAIHAAGVVEDITALSPKMEKPKIAWPHTTEDEIADFKSEIAAHDNPMLNNRR